MTLRRLRRVHIATDGVFSSCCRLQNGELLVNYCSAGPDGWNLNLVRSDDGGRTWSEPRIVVPTHGGSGADCELGMAQLADGSILLPFGRMQQGYSVAHRQSYVIRSTDNGRTWEEPFRLVPDGAARIEMRWANPYGRVLELSDGTVIVPVAGQFPGDRTWRNIHIRSHDGGRTWPETVTVAVGLDNEFDAIELPGGRMLAVHRDWRSPRYGHGVSLLWQNFSEDLGRTWSQPEITFQALYGHSPALFRTKRGTLICSYRYVGDLDIGVCGVGFSVWDEAMNEWGRNEHVVDTVGIGEYRLGCGYPCWDYADDERLLCVYHVNATYVPSPSHVWPENSFGADVEGTFYVDEP